MIPATGFWPAPDFAWAALAPVLLVLLAGCLGILLEALLPRRLRHVAQTSLTVASLVCAMGLLVVNWNHGRVGALVEGSLMLDGPTYFGWGALLVFGLLALMVFAERRVNGGASSFAASAAAVPGSADEAESARAGREHTEVFPLGLFAVGGMMVFLAAGDLLTMFVALEVFSLPLYLLCAMARRRRLLSQEAALKYFLLGAFSSAFFLMGIALVYVYSGTFSLAGIHDAVRAGGQGEGLLLAGLVLLAVGLLFKIGAVPFHNWTPDVYMGAPTPVTGFMAICTKLAAIGALLRVFYVALDGERFAWQPVLAVVAAATMTVGIVMALTQTDIKRMLAYSSIAHAGFILTAVVGAHQIVPVGQVTSAASIGFYLAAYGFATVGAFALVTLVRNAAGEENGIAGWAGLARKNPFAAGLFGLFLLSFAGIPLTGGFIGKWAVFTAAWSGGYWWLVVIAAVASLVGAWFYLRVVWVMFGGEPAPGTFVGRASGWTWIPIGIGALATVWLGILPDQVMQLATFAGNYLR